MRGLHLALMIVVAGGLSCATARAQDSDDDLARAHISSGRAYYERGRYEDAAREFLEAYRLSNRAELLDNASRAYERALLFDEAIETLERMRREHPESAQGTAIDERIANLERLRERVEGGRGEGDATATADTPDAPPPAETGSEGGGGGGVSIPGILVLSGGGALGLAALITGGVSHAMYEDVRSVCTDDGLCPADRQGDLDTGNALAITSTVLTFVSVAAMAAGVVILVVDTGGGGDEHVRLEATPGGLALSGRFR